MDGGPVHSNAFASLSKCWDKTSDFKADAALDSNLPGGAHVSRGKKRLFTDITHSTAVKEVSSLVLGLGPSSNIMATRCSPLEVEDDVSLDLGLSINLEMGVNRSCSSKVVIAGSSKTEKVCRPDLDLHLTLSTGTAESDVTTVTQGFVLHQNTSDSPVLVPETHLMDDGSTLSRWKRVPVLLPHKSQLHISSVFKQDDSGGFSNNNPTESSNPSTAVVLPSSVGSASGVNIKCLQRKSNVKTCRFEGCTRGARGASGLCIAHGGGRRCQKAGCHKGAEGKTVFCKAHGGGRRCQHLGCTRSAEGRTDYCISHGGGKRCSHVDCVRAARGKSGLCIRHGGGKRCKIENCTKSAEGISGLCISHGGGRRCQFPKCTKGAQGSTMFCKAHGGGRRCTFLGCTKGAEGSTPFCKGHGGGKRCTADGCTKSVHGGTLFCVGHGGGKRCVVPECTKSARGRTSYCVRHGGGKRCKFDGCPKSAQGSTDFCKAHGGGRRCSWGLLFSEFIDQDGSQCDKFARGKSGLCTAHSAQMQEKLHGSGTSENIRTASSASASVVHPSQSSPVTTATISFSARASFLDQLTLPEGRVHGGGLMAMLAKGKACVKGCISEAGDNLKCASQQ